MQNIEAEALPEDAWRANVGKYQRSGEKIAKIFPEIKLLGLIKVLSSGLCTRTSPVYTFGFLHSCLQFWS